MWADAVYFGTGAYVVLQYLSQCRENTSGGFLRIGRMIVIQQPLLQSLPDSRRLSLS